MKRTHLFRPVPHPAPPRRPLAAAAGLLGAALLAVLLACGGDRGIAPPAAALEPVPPPADLAQLDRAVQDQLDRLQERLRDADGEGGAAGEAWGALGQWYDVYGYTDSAGRCYRNAERLDPEEPRWPYYLGRLAEDDGRLDEARDRFERAAALAPEVAAPAVRLGDLALRRQDLDRAEGLYRRVLAVEPDDPGALFGRARVALARDRPEVALELLERLAREQPEASQVRYTMSLAWRRLGDDERAEELLRRLPESNVDQVPLRSGAAWDEELFAVDLGARTLTRRGVRAYRRGDHGRAAVLLGQAVQADPEGAEKRINYAVALHGIGRSRASLAELERAVELAEEGSELRAKAHLETGRILIDLGRPREAVDVLRSAVAIRPDAVPARVLLGLAFLRLGDLEAASGQYAELRRLAPEVAGARFWHASTLLALDRRQEAREALERDLAVLEAGAAATTGTAAGPGPDPAGARDGRNLRLLLARSLATTAAPAPRDLRRARDLLAASGPPDVLFAETAAMLAAAEARFAAARAWQEAALSALEDTRARSSVHTARRRLVLYREGRPCRTPWEAGERLILFPVDAPAGSPLAVGLAAAGGEQEALRPAAGAARGTGAGDGPVAGGAPAAEGAPVAQGESAVQGESAAGRRGAEDGPLFVDVAARTGLRFRHDNGRSGRLYFVEPVGSGGALADLDGDGDLDVVLVQGGPLVPPGEDPAAFPPSGGTRVFRNDLAVAADGGRRLRFTDVTEESGLDAHGYGMGIATGDYDGDGRVDLYLSGFGPNQLWRNVGTGGALRFEDVTARAGVDDSRWSTSSSFFDADGDGDLDLFVTNYVDFDLPSHRPCYSAGGRQDYCGPQTYRGETDRLFLNRGDGTFRDGTVAAGLTEGGSGLGAVARDFDGDGRMDLYVANDLQRNFLWMNLGNEGGVPRFENRALEAGCAVSETGQAQASMGVVAGDFDGDGDEDLFMTHLSADHNTLYVNQGDGLFVDRSNASGLAAPSLAGTGFGTVFVDYDNDGWLDVFVANGEVKVIEAQARAGDPFPLKQRNQLFANRGGRFVDVSGRAGPELERLEVSRGVAVGDVDDDGWTDLLLVNNDGPARLLRNQGRRSASWIGLRVVTATGRDAVGARVEVVTREGRRLWRKVATDGSYLSASDPRVLVGLGDSRGVEVVRVHWPGGGVESWSGLEAGRYHRLAAGGGTPTAAGPHPGPPPR